MAKFEFVEKYKNCGLSLPVRKTSQSAGYDLVAAEDTVIPSYFSHFARMGKWGEKRKTYSLEEMANLTKTLKTKPTLVSTGLKCKLDPGTYLELSVRSSSPLKYWLTLANSVGVIDADYYNNIDNEGEIFLQIINFAPFPILVKKGEAIGQGIIKPYLTTETDNASGERIGGFGSTSQKDELHFNLPREADEL